LNTRGLNKSGRVECLKDFIDNIVLNFVGLQETKKATFHEPFFNAVNNFSRNYVPTNGTAGGIYISYTR